MTAANYRKSLALTLAYEGGYSNHPADPGGATNFGVIQRVYDAYRRKLGLAIRSVRQIETVEVEEIYNKSYWRLVRGDSLPVGLDYAVFDFAVNSGVSRSVRFLQRIVGVDDDAVIGDATLNATYEAYRRDEEGLIATFCGNRLAFLRGLRTFSTFGRGWTRRVIGTQPGAQKSDGGVLDYATFMARDDFSFTMPTSIGGIAGETVSARAEAPPEPPKFPIAPPMTFDELKAKLPEVNDQLAAEIAAS